MRKAHPIKSTEDIQKLKQYYLDRQQIRNYTLVNLGMNTSLWIGDLLLLKQENVYDFCNRCYYRHLKVREQKTGKNTLIALNRESLLALKNLKESISPVSEKDYLFKSREGINKPICCTQAFRIIKQAADSLHIVESTISCHSLRKTLVIMLGEKGFLLLPL